MAYYYCKQALPCLVLWLLAGAQAGMDQHRPGADLRQ
jgi:hypothetical protein